MDFVPSADGNQPVLSLDTSAPIHQIPRGPTFYKGSLQRPTDSTGETECVVRITTLRGASARARFLTEVITARVLGTGTNAPFFGVRGAFYLAGDNANEVRGALVLPPFMAAQVPRIRADDDIQAHAPQLRQLLNNLFDRGYALHTMDLSDFIRVSGDRMCLINMPSVWRIPTGTVRPDFFEPVAEFLRSTAIDAGVLLPSEIPLAADSKEEYRNIRRDLVTW